MSTLQPRMRPSETVVFAKVDEEAVLLDLDSGTYFGLNSTGCQFWELIAQGATEEEVVDHLVARYDIGPRELQEQLTDFLELLAVKGLVRVE